MSTPTQNPQALSGQTAPARPEKLSSRPTLPAAVDIYESKDDFLILADMPGATQQDVDVRFDKNQLNLSARVKMPQRNGSAAAEMEWGRQFVLPGSVDAGNISAELKDGVLTVRLPKKESLKPRQITVRAG